MKSQQDFCCFNEELSSIKFYSNQSCLHLALPCLTLPCLTPSHLVAYLILKSLIVSYHIKMHLVLWQLTIWYGYLTHLDQLWFSFPVSFYLIQSLFCPALFHHHLIWFYSFTRAQLSRGGVTVMVSSHMLQNLVEALI